MSRKINQLIRCGMTVYAAWLTKVFLTQVALFKFSNELTPLLAGSVCSAHDATTLLVKLDGSLWL